MRIALLPILVFVPVVALAEEVKLTFLPAEKGVLLEAQTVFAAPAEKVAARAADPATFIVIFPAVKADVIGREDGALVVSVVMEQPWPAGRVEWVERVERRAAAGAQVVHRVARPGVTYKTMEATWTFTPLDGNRCQATYRVNMDLNRWAPRWMLRPGMTKGVRSTIEALRRLVE